LWLSGQPNLARTLRMNLPRRGLAARCLPLALPLLLGGCAAVDDEPIPVIRRGPHLLLQVPAVIEQDTVVASRTSPYTLVGRFSLDNVDDFPLKVQVNAAEDGRAVRTVAQQSYSFNTGFSYPYQAAPAQQNARIDVLVTDKYTQLDSHGFWLRFSSMPAPTVSFVSLPNSAVHGQQLAARARLSSATDLPTELRLYRYENISSGAFRLTLLSTIGEPALLAARQSGTSTVDFPAYTVPADIAPGTSLNLLLHGRTKHKLQAEAYGLVTINP